MTWERYKDNYGGRVALRYPYNIELNAAMKAQLPFPQSKWDGSKGAWSIQDQPVVIEKALELLALYDIDMDGLSGDNCAESDSGCVVQFAPPDKLLLQWGFQSNYKQINAAMKDAAAGNAKWKPNDKHWMIPIASAIAVANAVRPHFAPLVEAIEDNSDVKASHAETLQRVELSSAVE